MAQSQRKASRALMPCPRCGMHSCICPPPPKVYAVAAPPPRPVPTVTRCTRCGLAKPCCCPTPPREPRLIVSPPPRSCGTPSQDLLLKVKQPASPLGPALVQVTCPRCRQAIRYPASLIQVCGCGPKSLLPVIAAKPFKAPVRRPPVSRRIPSPIELEDRIERVEVKVNASK